MSKKPEKPFASACSENLADSVAKYKHTIEFRNKHLDEISAEICALETTLSTTPPGFEYRFKISETPIEESHQPPPAHVRQDDNGKPLIVACEYLSWRRQPSNRFRLCYELSLHAGFEDKLAPSPMPWRLQSTPFRSEIKPFIECKASLRSSKHGFLSTFVEGLNERAKDHYNRRFNDGGIPHEGSCPLITDGYFLGEVIGQ
jgi:hypothetical protein